MDQNALPVLGKEDRRLNGARLFLLELRHISTISDNFWRKDGKQAKIM